MATEPEQQLALRQQLKAYLERAIEVAEQWTSWLADYQQSILSGEMAQLENHSQRAGELFRSMKELGSVRGQLLASAGTVGVKAQDAKSLSRSLAKSRGDESLRADLRKAELQMAQLRRLARATWVLISQCARMTDETLMLMTLGRSENSVYIESPMADNCGGYLLDAQA